jgi:hypothetical protein
MDLPYSIPLSDFTKEPKFSLPADEWLWWWHGMRVDQFGHLQSIVPLIVIGIFLFLTPIPWLGTWTACSNGLIRRASSSGLCAPLLLAIDGKIGEVEVLEERKRE